MGLASTACTPPGSWVSRYWTESRRPLTALAFVAPLLVLYEAGVCFLGPQAVRNGADVLAAAVPRSPRFRPIFSAPLAGGRDPAGLALHDPAALAALAWGAGEHGPGVAFAGGLPAADLAIAGRALAIDRWSVRTGSAGRGDGDRDSAEGPRPDRISRRGSLRGVAVPPDLSFAGGLGPVADPRKRGQPPFAGTARRVLRTNGDCPLFRPCAHRRW